MADSLSPSTRTQLFSLCFLATTALLLFRSTLSYTHVHLNNIRDQRALLAFKLSTNDPMNTMSNWKRNTSFCNWNGVSCSRRRQRVVALNLAGMSLKGTISPYLANLSFLHVLNLCSNLFHGTPPIELGQLARLRILDLSENNLEGAVPQSLCLCHSLQQLVLSHNQFEGAIGACLGSLPDLKYLYLGSNKFIGITIPPSLGNLSKLEHLDLSSNGLVGNIPDGLGNLSLLRTINLAHNNLTGMVPQSMFNISTLQSMALGYNGLHGQLPRDTGIQLPNLEKLDLTMNGFSGEIPKSLVNCERLQMLLLGNNRFSGSVLSWLGSMPNLAAAVLNDNEFTGTISPYLANLSTLQVLTVSRNRLIGEIPETIGMLSQMEFLDFDFNNLTGTVPPSIFNMSSLHVLSLTNNRLKGRLPQDVGSTLTGLLNLLLDNNSFDGQIPTSLGNATKLEIIGLSANKFSGTIPLELGRLQHLEKLVLSGNLLTNMPGTTELSIITALTECTALKVFDFSDNLLSGILPTSIGNLSSNINEARMRANQIRGTIPLEITNLTNLYLLDLSDNRISGDIPSDIGRLHDLQGLYLYGNMLEGFIPPQFYQMVKLVNVDLSENMLCGQISSSISNLSNLQLLYLSSNNLSSTIPPSFWQLKNLGFVFLQDNSLTGSLPLEIGNLANVYQMDFSANKLFGDLPASLGKLQMLQYLNLSNNIFSGYIPQKLETMVNLETLDLSHNSLSGEIPKDLGQMRNIKSLDLSFNQLVGEIPSDGIFANLTADSFEGNYGLCGASRFGVPRCSNKNKQHKRFNLTGIVIASAVGSCAFLFVVALLVIKPFREKAVAVKHDLAVLFPRTKHPLISYRELLHATNNFDDSNLIGSGSFGSVYRGILSDGTKVAVKVLNLLFEGALNSFSIECEIMRKVRHRNLLRIISSCTNEEFKALVLQYMPRGSLEDCLYASAESLNLLQRLDIMIDVACAMEYLHHDFFEPVLHCDLKPSNVLLDDDLTAYVADFGIAKMLAGSKSSTLTETLGSTGYIAPEFGMSGKVSTKADVYSYGVLLLETFTRRKPTDPMFAGDFSLIQWVADELTASPDAVLEVIDGCLLDEYSGSSHTGQREAVRSITKNELLVSILQVGLLCSRESPRGRTNMRQVVADLKKIREKLSILETANMARNVLTP
ncbi:LRR receptor-like serine/threonine-protein kinase EFR [Nymphaea colorata]|nr:LRR receptor-like serine/threonine-protein kinase EFR [Nymphaea colorata]